MRRPSLRLRVSLAFAVAMAIVLAATGFFVYAKLGSDLDHALDQDLRLRAQDLQTLVADAGSVSAETGGRLVERGESFAEVLDPRGAVLDATASIRGAALLAPGQARRALHSDLLVDRPSVPGLDEPARLLAVAARRNSRPVVLVVGATKENRAEALPSLRTELLIGGPIALVVATLLGYLLAGTGLRAVEAMRRRAAAISAENPGERLPMPGTGDELERLGATLNDMLARLESAVARERAFVADAGHELRTPLALLRTELDFALHHAVDETELRAALRSASAETDRLVQLAGDLLLLAGSDDGRIALRVEPVDDVALLESVRNRYAWRADDEARELRVRPAGARLNVDRLRIEQALGNLVHNALVHGAGPVEVFAEPVSGGVRLGVADAGAGFPAEFAGRAFERFTRGDESRHGEGAGLGLAVVEAVARAHGGAARLDRVAGRTEVVLALPRDALEAAASACADAGP